MASLSRRQSPLPLAHGPARLDAAEGANPTAPALAAGDLSYAVATPSYAADFERCRLLCESMSRFVAGARHHYVLVEDADAALFRRLEGPNRTVVTDSDLLPGWLRPYRDPFSLGRRKAWLSLRTWPLRGWHVQQLRKLAVARHLAEDVLLFCDSDVVFVRPFDLSGLAGPEGVRLYRKDRAITPDMAEHARWCGVAADLLGLPAPTFPRPDYINNLISWRREAALGLLARIEETTGEDWVTALGRRRGFSEYTLYGTYVDEVLGTRSAHRPAEAELCHTHWSGGPLTAATLAGLMAGLGVDQVAVGIQSYTGTSTHLLRTLLRRT